ncbi:hypothetical protein SEA_MOLEFICENT_15 [Microbacterium phage Moleficent]|uniref:Uncharacterized protein n=6 Tax=Akonivirus TaxID=2842540 RepID=A0A6M3T3U9_9CAUD|nr:hypothetical protein HWD33_gp15 [Microbacterium phage Phedro]QFG04980.1 hypothetical protein SEA_PHRIEDRICE_15 [Microbacterium phage PhriedRice]QJD52867.1 hypothetical protein SEA_PHRACTURED_15 [Microbacterium phage Phractured]QJD52977.1 hypothetical protein SEA_PHARKY_15 [Microbacterium phage Pharky]QNL30317.1 hypothetical protein SEA_MAZUN_15 [Microbacterium phage Mazun]QWY82707.1 hypothetical protein SEA_STAGEPHRIGHT_15 [Microbacterium phage StagePhright]UXE04104.1 hypothetical protein 
MKYDVRTGNTGAYTRMTEEEFKQWLEMFMADTSLGSTFEVIRRPR